MNKEEIKKIASSLLFDVTEEVLKDFEEFFEQHLQDLKAFEKIDTTGVKPMSFIDETPKTFMRDDVPGKSLEKEKLLNNATNKNDDFVILSKVVDSEN